MTKHDGSTNTHAFTSPDHAMMCGAIVTALSLFDERMDWTVEAGVTENDDYLPHATVTTKNGKQFRVIIAEIVP